MLLKFGVNDDKLCSFGEETTHTGSRNFYSCKFVFDEVWQNCDAFAVFRQNGVCFGPVLVVNGVCALPVEVIERAGSFEVGVYGVDGEKEVRISTNWCRMNVEEGAYSEDTTAPEQPQADVWEDYMAYLSAALKNSVPYIGDNGNWFLWDGEKYYDTELPSQGEKGEKGLDGIDGKNGVDGKDGKNGSDGKDGINGADGYSPIKGVDYWTEADKAEIKAEIEPIMAAKADNVTVVFPKYADTIMLNHNHDIRLGTVDGMVLRVPQGIGDYYECMLSFTASEEGVSVYVLPQYNDYSDDNILWLGDDVDETGIFYPQPGNRYEVSFKLVEEGTIVARVGEY